jgi:hypothetical protein
MKLFIDNEKPPVTTHATVCVCVFVCVYATDCVAINIYQLLLP